MSSEPTPTIDDLYEVLSNRRRRFAIHYLQQNGTQADLGTISEHVAAWEFDRSIEAISPAERKRVYTSLQQFHLPKMSQLNVVSYDTRSGMVSLQEEARDLEYHLEIVRKYDLPWSFYYLGLVAVGVGSLGLIESGMAAVGVITVIDWAVFHLAAFAILAIVHTRESQQMRLGDEGPPPELKQ